MKRSLFALLCMVMLVFCLFPLPAEAAEEEINIGEWFSAHPDPQVTELVRESLEYELDGETVPFPVSWTVKMKKKQKETQDILSYHSQAAGCSDKARAKASGGRQPIEECGRTGL